MVLLEGRFAGAGVEADTAWVEGGKGEVGDVGEVRDVVRRSGWEADRSDGIGGHQHWSSVDWVAPSVRGIESEPTRLPSLGRALQRQMLRLLLLPLLLFSILQALPCACLPNFWSSRDHS